jgi:hypothetical protein
LSNSSLSTKELWQKEGEGLLPIPFLGMRSIYLLYFDTFAAVEPGIDGEAVPSGPQCFPGLGRTQHPTGQGPRHSRVIRGQNSDRNKKMSIQFSWLEYRRFCNLTVPTSWAEMSIEVPNERVLAQLKSLYGWDLGKWEWIRGGFIYSHNLGGDLEARKIPVH